MKEETVPEFGAIVADFLEYKRAFKGSRYRTLKAYRDHLRPMEVWLDGRDIRTVTWQEVRAWINRITRMGTAPSKNTVRNRTVLTTNFYRYLIEVRRLEMSVDAAMVREFKANKVAPKRQKFIPDGDWLSVYNLPPIHPERDLAAFYWPGMDRDDIVWLGLGYYWGFRAIEIMSIRPEEVEPGFWLDFERKGPEGANRHRFNGQKVFDDDLRYLDSIGDPDRFLEALEELRKERTDQEERFLMRATIGDNVEVNGPDGATEWIATDRDAQWLNRRLDILLRNNGLSRTLFTPHSLRHSAATNLARSGASPERITFLMNHQSYDTSLGYINLAEFEHQRAHNTRRRQVRAAELLSQDDED